MAKSLSGEVVWC